MARFIDNINSLSITIHMVYINLIKNQEKIHLMLINIKKMENKIH
jgi:hypothetical protein